MERMTIKLNTINSKGDWAAPKKLVRSMAEMGQITPILVLGFADGDMLHFDIVDGRRRVAAAEELGWDLIDALVCTDEMEAQRAAVTTLAANLHSSNPLSEARAVEAAGGASVELWQAAGLSVAEVEARTKLLNLAPDFQGGIERGELKMSAARKLATLPEHSQQRRAYEIAREMQKRDGWRPTVKMIDIAVRQVRGELQPQMPLPPNVVSWKDVASSGPDPVAIAAALRAFIKKQDRTMAIESCIVLEDAITFLENL